MGFAQPGNRRDGARRRLVLSYDPDRNALVGTVENTTEQTLCAVRVEVHLAGGSELGPTTRTDGQAGLLLDDALVVILPLVYDYPGSRLLE